MPINSGELARPCLHFEADIVSRIEVGRPIQSDRCACSLPSTVADLYGRLYGVWLVQRLGRPGPGGNNCDGSVVRAPSDGYTLLWVTSANAWNATLYANLKFDFHTRHCVSGLEGRRN